MYSAFLLLFSLRYNLGHGLIYLDDTNVKYYFSFKFKGKIWGTTRPGLSGTVWMDIYVHQWVQEGLCWSHAVRTTLLIKRGEWSVWNYIQVNCFESCPANKVHIPYSLYSSIFWFKDIFNLWCVVLQLVSDLWDRRSLMRLTLFCVCPYRYLYI